MPDEIPSLLKHAVLAVYKSPYTKGRGSTRFWNAVDIVKAHFSKHKYIVSEDDIRLTAKGKRRNQHHATERGGKRKDKEFDQLYAMAMRNQPREF